MRFDKVIAKIKGHIFALYCRMVWLSGGENFEDMFIRFDRIHEHDRRTDGHRTAAA